ncbi:MAG TPA: hypothetical protein V6C72_12910, partial [Chroococcales cyanobacterium]
VKFNRFQACKVAKLIQKILRLSDNKAFSMNLAKVIGRGFPAFHRQVSSEFLSNLLAANWLSP